jgi:hypothetical protein
MRETEKGEMNETYNVKKKKLQKEIKTKNGKGKDK